MRLLDRYVLATFLKNYLISFMVLVGLYIVLDLVINFDELIEVQTRGTTAASTGGASFLSVLYVVFDYYFFQVFLIFAQLSGIIPVVAAAFTLVRLARFNELTAMLAAGVPLLRVAAPIIYASIGVNLLLVADQELVVPRLIPKLTRTHDQAGQAASKSFDIKAMQDGNGGLIFASRYTPPTENTPAVMLEFDLIERDAQLRPVAHIVAEKAQFDPRNGAWNLTKGTRITGLSPDDRRPRDREWTQYKSDVTPEEIALFRSGSYVDLLSTARINQLLQRPQSYGTVSLLRVKHSRLTQFVMNLIIVLIAIACVLTREPGTLKANGLRLLILVGMAMAGVFLCHQLAEHPPPGEQWTDRWPALMAWLPIFLFAPVSIWLLDRLHTRKS